MSLSLITRRPRILDRIGRLVVPTEDQRIEQMLAAARTFLAAGTFFAIYLEPTQPARFVRLVYMLMGFYSIHSLAVQFLVLFRDKSTRGFRLTVHTVDILWPPLISLFTYSEGSPFFLFTVFVLSAAAYRWGLGETIPTAVASIVL